MTTAKQLITGLKRGGNSLGGIAKEMNKRGYRADNGKKWTRKSVKRELVKKY